MDNREEFNSIFSKIERPGAEAMKQWLEESDFFEAPASTRFHLSEKGGLAQHSVNVAKRLMSLCAVEAKKGNMEMPTTDTIAVCGLLHDVCKANFYTVEMRNKKDESGKWVQVPFYTVNDQFPYGHGEKSVYIINKFLDLSDEEAQAIRFHMGAWQEGEGQNVGNAFNRNTLAVLLHIADMEATYIDEAQK